MESPPRPYVVFVRASTEEVRALALTLDWPMRASEHVDETSWQVDSESHVTWHALDEGFGAFLVASPAWQVILADLGDVFDLLGDVDLMSAVGSAATLDELSLWGTRLCEFARGHEFYEQTLNVIVGLLASEHFDFAAAAVRGLARARWPQLVDPLTRAAARWPELDYDCRRALASINR